MSAFSFNTTYQPTGDQQKDAIAQIGIMQNNAVKASLAYREITTPFLVRGFFPDVLCLSSYCAGRSGCVTGMMLALILLINKQHNTGYL